MNDDTVIKLTVNYRGTDLADSTVRVRMEAADPGTGWLDCSMRWSCPKMAQYAKENIQYTFGPSYTVRKEEVAR